MHPITSCPVFGLYAASRKLIKIYTQSLEKVGLTYPQFLVISCLLAKDDVSVDDLGKALFLDSGTLTPLLKRLEVSGFITRAHSRKDERMRVISLTSHGRSIEKVLEPMRDQIRRNLDVTHEEIQHLNQVLAKILSASAQHKKEK